MAESHRMLSPRKILVKDLNTCLTCTLCNGYFIDATIVVDCSHTFCRACIVRHFESSRLCPSCGSLVHKSKPLSKLRSDPTLQSLVYKVVPALYSKELQRRSDFYHSTSFRANSSCSDDSVLGDRTQDNEEWAASNIGDPSLYFSPDDSISLSVEYYTKEAHESESKPKEEDTDTLNSNNSNNNNNTSESLNPNNNTCDPLKPNNNTDSLKSDPLNSDSKQDSITSEQVKSEPVKSEQIASEPNLKNGDLSDKSAKDKTKPSAEVSARDAASGELGGDSGLLVSGLAHKRFLQCPAAVRMSHLMKFLRMKFALSNEHRVDIIYAGEVLPPYLSLMDVAYTFKWDRAKPMRFFYLIYIPILRPVVAQQPEPVVPVVQPPIPPLKIEIPNNKLDLKENNTSPTEKHKKHKEIKIKEPVKPEEDIKKEDNNNLKKIDSKPTQKSVKFTDYKPNNIEYKIKTNDTVQASTAEKCVYEYAEPDKDEMKAFAERRDREWAMQKYPEVHVSKKRKKSKHSKNEMHKKRKLHAEITSNEVLSNTDDSLKLKVKLSVANGHKHKHRSSSSNVAIVEPIKTHELSPKERLLQMRQVRHKPVTPNSDDKPKTNPAEPNIKMVISAEKHETFKMPDKPETSQKTLEQKSPENILATGKTLRSDFSNKTLLSKDICNKYVRVSLEKFSDKTSPPKKVNNFNKTDTKDERNTDGKTEIIPIENKTDNKHKADNTLSIKPTDNKPSSKILDNKLLDKINKLPTSKPSEINNLTITETEKTKPNFNPKPVDFKPAENLNKTPDTKSNKTTEPPKMAPKTEPPKLLSPKPVVDRKSPIDESKVIENKLNNIDFKTQSSTLVTKNFTVSKVESGTKRKLETPETTSDKRPSLEITVINLVSRPSPTSGIQTAAVQSKPASSCQTKPTISKPVTKPAVSKPPVTKPAVTKPAMTKPVVTKPVVTKPVSNPTTPEGPPAKKIRPPPLTIPLGRIKNMSTLNKTVQKPTQKPPENKCDIFGALDLSAKPTKPEMKPEFRAHSASPKAKVQDQIQNMIRPKTPIKTGQDIKTDPNKSLEKLQRPNISNLQMLSESAVQIRELMSKGSIPNLIKKLPSPIQNSGQKNDFMQKNFQQKPPNLLPKTAVPRNINNLPPKPPNFISKNLQKLPKLNEINKAQFSRINPGQIRPPRPAGQNQTIRNIPNPSLLVRQQNQNRINSLNNTNAETKKPETNGKPENAETEKRPSEHKTSEPPPLKPIESFKK